MDRTGTAKAPGGEDPNNAPSTENPNSAPSGQDPTNSDQKLSQIKMFLDIYQQHFDLFHKGVLLYLTIVAAAGYVIVAVNAQKNAKALLALGTSIISVLIVAWCRISD